MHVCDYACVMIKVGGWWRKRVTVITLCAWCGAKLLASINLDTCVCVCARQRESSVSRDGDVAGNTSATVARSRQPEPPLHRPRLSPPSRSPSISAAHLHSTASQPLSHSLPQRQRKRQLTVVWLWSYSCLCHTYNLWSKVMYLKAY